MGETTTTAVGPPQPLSTSALAHATMPQDTLEEEDTPDVAEQEVIEIDMKKKYKLSVQRLKKQRPKQESTYGGSRFTAASSDNMMVGAPLNDSSTLSTQTFL